MEEVANPIAKASFDRVEPAVETMCRRLGFRLRQARRRAIARHGVISAGVPTPESLVGPSWRLRRLQFPTTPPTAPWPDQDRYHCNRDHPQVFRHCRPLLATNPGQLASRTMSIVPTS